jgi:hypothetical protein
MGKPPGAQAMADLAVLRAQTLYLAPTKGRRYMTAKSAAYAEARALLDRKYPREYPEYENGMMIYGGSHWSEDESNNRAYERLGRAILRKFRQSKGGRKP